MNQLHVFYHDDCEKHEISPNHPESPVRYSAIKHHLDNAHFSQYLEWSKATEAPNSLIELAHPNHYVQSLENASPSQDSIALDADTSMNPFSLRAAKLAVGATYSAAMKAHELSIPGFSLIRPPGHHAESQNAMGFCLFNQIAVTALYLTKKLNYKRVAIIDFDVHHGNGTEEIVAGNKRIFFFSTFQHPLYPHSGVPPLAKNITNVPLVAGTRSDDYRMAFDHEIVTKLEKLQPDFILISAGFDAHQADPLAQINLKTGDFAWIGHKIKAIANRYCPGKIVAGLEGGYHISALTDSCIQFLEAIKSD